MTKKKIILNNDFLIEQKVEKVLEAKTVNKDIKHAIPESVVFKHYKPLSEIAAKIAKELTGTAAFKIGEIGDVGYKEIKEKGLAFFMSSDNKKTGLLSLLPAVYATMILYEKMEDKNNSDKDEVKKEKVLDCIKTGIDAIFKFIYRDKGDGENINNDCPVFDASPFVVDEFYPGSSKEKSLESRSFIETVTWAVPLFIKILRDGKNNTYGTEENRNKARKLIKWCLDYVNLSLLTKNEGENEIPLGWSFTKLNNSNNDDARSLYFTYAASTVYISIHRKYGKLLNAFRCIDRTFENYKKYVYDNCLGDGEKKFINDLIESKYWEDNFKTNLKKAEEKIEKWKNDENDSKDDLVKFKEALDTINKKENIEMKNELMDFNDNFKIGYTGYKYLENEKIKNKDIKKRIGSITYLKWTLEFIAEELWENIGKRLDKDYMFDDFSGTIASEETIESGSQTNVLFSGLLHIGIILNSGYDLIIQDEKGQDEYEDIQETMLLHVQRVQRYYEKLEEKNKSYGSKSLILRFAEPVKDKDNDELKEDALTDRELAVLLRKQEIRVCSLTPFLLNTNNLISEYIIRYPQKQMGESLTSISRKRFKTKEKRLGEIKETYSWYWEEDEYHALSNYYYITAIYDFYEYYKNYEKLYIDYYENIRQKLVNDAEYSKGVSEHYQKLENEKNEKIAYIKKEKDIVEAALKEKEAEIEKLNNQIGVGGKFEILIKEIISNEKFLNETFLKSFIKALRVQIGKDIYDYHKTFFNDKTSYETDNDIYLKKLRNFPHVEPKEDTTFGNIQALLADVILYSAIKHTGGDGVIDRKELGNDKASSVAKFSDERGEDLIRNGVIGKLFADMLFKNFDWNEK